MNELNTPELEKLLAFYSLGGKFEDVRPLGNGHINDTLLLTFREGEKRKRYVLQKINASIFHSPGELMENIVRVTDFLRGVITARGGDAERETLRVIPAKNGEVLYYDEEGGAWRITGFIEDSHSCDTASKPEDMYITGKAFGGFQSDLSAYPAQLLHEIIPGFHDTRARFAGFVKTAEADPCGRAEQCRAEIEFITARENLARFSMDAFDAGKLPLRVTHNDTKMNNLMLDDATGEAVCVIDLDTVQPGFAMNDFGDAIRSGACTAAEDERDLERVSLSLELYEAFARGFIESCGEKLTDYELETLPTGALCITYEQALRFLEDYLRGDTYYKTAYPGHNLVRARTQIKLVRETEEKWTEIQRIIEKCRQNIAHTEG